MASAAPPPAFLSRPRHRKRFSVSRLSSDTTATLPEYTSSARGSISISSFPNFQQSVQTDTKDVHDEDELEQPPEYPDSADEADEETDEFDTLPVLPLSPPPVSPRRKQQRLSAPRPARHLYTHPAAQSDIYLDSLLARSVHALELSNALLQSSMSTQTSLAAVLDPRETGSERRLDSKAKALTARIRRHEGMQERWMDDLDGLARDVEALCSDGPDRNAEGIGVPTGSHSRSSSNRSNARMQMYDGPVSRSLPSAGFAVPRRQRSWLGSQRRSHSNSIPCSHSTHSTVDLSCSRSGSGKLQYDSPENLVLQSPPPRAITQYVNVESDMGDTIEASATSDASSSIYLPSTLGLHSHSSASANRADFAPSASLGILVSSSPPTSAMSSASTYPNATSSPAYVSLTQASSSSPLPTSTFSSRSSRISRSPTPTYSQHHQQRPRSRSRSSLSSSRSAASASDSPHQGPHARSIPPAITPIAELPSQSDSSSSASESSPGPLHPFRTVESLRKILDEQPQPAMPSSSSDTKGKGRSLLSKAPAFTPRSPPVEPVIGTSSLTTSISRLYTKGSHSTSTRAPSPPRQSSLKHRPPAIAASLSGSSTLSIPDFGAASGSGSAAGAGTPAGGSSRTSSGRSTPRNVVFGPLPESYASSKPPGAPSKFQAQRERRSSRKRSGSSHSHSNSKGGGERGDKDREESNSWWTTWLTGGSVLSMSAARHEEKTEDRMARTWGRPAMGGGYDEWPV